MEFPTLVYRCPGNCQRKGGTYAWLPVKDEAQLDAALADGWFVTLPEAIQAHDLPQKPAIAPVIEALIVADAADNAPPNRDELEQKAKELGIKFDGRTSDKKLAASITEALNA